MWHLELFRRMCHEINLKSSPVSFSVLWYSADEQAGHWLTFSLTHWRFYRQNYSNGFRYRTDNHKPLQICLIISWPWSILKLQMRLVNKNAVCIKFMQTFMPLDSMEICLLSEVDLQCFKCTWWIDQWLPIFNVQCFFAYWSLKMDKRKR